MKKIILLLASSAFLTLGLKAQGYDIKINLKGCKDSLAFLVRYDFGQTGIVDTCKSIKNGLIEFKGKRDLEKGVYTLVSDAKSIYFDFFINESEKFTMSADVADIVGTVKATGNKENEQFFSYTKYLTSKNQDYGKLLAQTKGKSKEGQR